MKLTTKFVENITKAGKYYDQHGLFLHVRPSGAKKWLQRYTIVRNSKLTSALIPSNNFNNYTLDVVNELFNEMK